MAGKHMMNAAICLLLTAGLAVMETPSLLDLYAQMHQQLIIGGYDSRISYLDDEEVQAKLREASMYNSEIYRQQQAAAFMYRQTDPEDTVYFAMLDEGDADHTMALLTIPEIHLSLPVVHGTDEEMLKYEAGHMYGTSLPNGGASTHCVIAAHTGLVSARLFTDLVELEPGDHFFLTVFNEKHGYVVDQIVTVLPEEESFYLQVEDGSDYVTLYTCTPYGVNDHRLLVRGIRSDMEEMQFSTLEIRKEKYLLVMKALLLLLFPMLFFCAAVRYVFLMKAKEEQ